MPKKLSASITPINLSAPAAPTAVAPTPLLLDIPAVARLLSTTVWAVRSLHWSRKLRFSKLGKRFVVSADRVREFAANFGA